MLRLLAPVLALALCSCAVPALADPAPLGDPRISVANDHPWLARPADPWFTRSSVAGIALLIAADVASSRATDHLPGVYEAGAGGLLGAHPSLKGRVLYGLGELGADAAAVWTLQHVFHANNATIAAVQLGVGGAEVAAVANNVSLLGHH